VPARDRAAVRVEARILGLDAQPVAPREHLHREGLVQLEESDVVERDSRLLEHLARRRHRSEAHQLRLNAGVGKADEPHLRLEAVLGRPVLGGDERRRRSVRQSG
jgi:hypothetical protein